MDYSKLRAKVIEVIGLQNFHVLSDLFRTLSDVVIVKNRNEDTYFAFYEDKGEVKVRSLGNRSEMEKFVSDAYGYSYSINGFSKLTLKEAHQKATKKALETLKSLDK